MKYNPFMSISCQNGEPWKQLFSNMTGMIVANFMSKKKLTWNWKEVENNDIRDLI